MRKIKMNLFIVVLWVIVWHIAIPKWMQSHIPEIKTTLERTGYANVEYKRTSPYMRRLVFTANNATSNILWQFGDGGVSSEYPSAGSRLRK